MKNSNVFAKLSVLIAILFCSSYAYAQCNDYYVMEQGTEWTYENINGKGKSVGKNQQKVTAFEKTSTGFNATIHSVFTDDKGKNAMEGDLEMKCSNGTMTIDMRKFLPEEQLKAFGSYEMQIESENLELPSRLSVGQSLKDGSINLSAVGSPMAMTMSVKITERKVVGKESITTPAGTFDCFKITSKSTSSTKMGISMTFEFTTTEWMAEKVGLVKSESLDKKGKSIGYTILVARK